MLRVFVYGTLKRGFRNHALYCRGLQSCVPAALPGRVVERPEGYPTLFAPEATILAHGGTSPHEDALLLQDIPPISQDQLLNFAATPWRLVLGELLAFDDPGERLPALDDLEDFFPSKPSEYCRVLASALTAEGPLSCWAYVSPHNKRCNGVMSKAS